MFRLTHHTKWEKWEMKGNELQDLISILGVGKKWLHGKSSESWRDFIVAKKNHGYRDYELRKNTNGDRIFL